MNRQLLTFALAILIALQSVVAVADVHQFQQSGSEHLTFDHEHQKAHSSPIPDDDKRWLESEKSKSYQLDCHHCCHCHGSSHPFFLGRQDISASLYQKGAILGNPSHYRSHIAFPDNPPPIS